MPQARQGGNGVYSFAVVGSKLDGTGFGKLHIVQTHVADVTDGVLAAGERKLESAPGRGDAEALLEGLDVTAAARDCNEPRLAGLGMRVTLAEDLRKRACRRRHRSVAGSAKGGRWGGIRSIHIAPRPSGPGRPSAFWAPAGRHSKCDARSGRPGPSAVP
jgi:hypothetical protein